MSGKCARFIFNLHAELSTYCGPLCLQTLCLKSICCVFSHPTLSAIYCFMYDMYSLKYICTAPKNRGKNLQGIFQLSKCCSSFLPKEGLCLDLTFSVVPLFVTKQDVIFNCKELHLVRHTFGKRGSKAELLKQCLRDIKKKVSL